MENIVKGFRKLTEFCKSMTAILTGLGAIIGLLVMIWRNVATIVDATNDMRRLIPVVKQHEDYIKIEISAMIDIAMELDKANIYDERQISKLITIRDELPNFLTYTQKQKINNLENKLRKNYIK